MTARATGAELPALPDHTPLPEPHDGMTPEEKGRLLLTYVAAGRSVAGLDFSESLLDGADLAGADLRNAVLSRARMRGASLRGAQLSGARLDGVDMENCDLLEAVYEGADFAASLLVDAHLPTILVSKAGVGKSAVAALISGRTYRRSGWRPRDLGAWLLDGAVLDRPGEFPAEVHRWLTSDPEGLTLTLDTHLHRLDPAAIEVLIAELFGDDAGIAVEERSGVDAEGPAFIRINGKNPDQLAQLAQAFYERAWRKAMAAAEEQAIDRLVPRGFGMVLVRLDTMRDGCTGMSLRAATEGGSRDGAALVRPDPRVAIADLDRLFKEENKVRALEQVIVRVIEPGGLYAWTRTHFGIDVAAALPGAIGGDGHVAAGAVAVWAQHGLIDAALFRLLAEENTAVADAVWDVARKWGVERG